MPVTLKVRKDAVERAKEAIKDMEMGIPISESCRRNGTTLGTVKKVAKSLHIKTKIRRTRTGRRRVIVDAHKIDKAQCVVRLMQYEHKSATEACKACHTTIGTVRSVRLDNCRTLRRSHGTYRLQVYEVKKFAVVFFGRLRNRGSEVAITHTSPLVEDGLALRKDNYASIQWQYDFNVFRSTLSSSDVCDYYMARVLSHLKEKCPVEEVFRPGVELDAEAKCGVDDRRVTASFVCKSTLAKSDTDDNGAFQVLVIRKSGKITYPVTPHWISYPHSLISERNWKER